MFKIIKYILLTWFVIVYVLGFVESSIETTRNIIDVLENGPPPLREGYIPPSKRKVEGVKFVPYGADPAYYIKSE